MKMLRNRDVLKVLKKASQVYFSKAASLQCTHNRFFSEDVPKC